MTSFQASEWVQNNLTPEQIDLYLEEIIYWGHDSEDLYELVYARHEQACMRASRH